MRLAEAFREIVRSVAGPVGGPPTYKVAFACAGALGAVGLIACWNHFVPVLTTWENFHAFYYYGAVDPFLSFRIAPRANIAGNGYPLLDLGASLTGHWGPSLTTLRAASAIYALASYAGMILIFGRWFGMLPAVLGATFAALSIGFVFMASQAIVVFPTFFLCVFFVERLQRLDHRPQDAGQVLVVGAILALLMIHYGMGRFFAVFWLVYFLLERILIVSFARLQPRDARRYLGGKLALAGGCVLAGAVVLVLLDIRNAEIFFRPWQVFFPPNGTEVEFSAAKLLPTIASNMLHVVGMLFPFLADADDTTFTCFLSGCRTPMLSNWHAPFLLLGFAVAVARTFRRDARQALPYLSLHALLAITIGISLFSLRSEVVDTISPYRIFGGYLAIAGYLTACFHWLLTVISNPPIAVRNAVVAGLIAVITAAGIQVSVSAGQALSQISALVSIDAKTGKFHEVPPRQSASVEQDNYTQIEFHLFAEKAAKLLECLPDRKPVILQVRPKLILHDGKYEGLHFIRQYNDLSVSFMLYLREAGINAAYVNVHPARSSGAVQRGDGYGGRPRVFSGPISWDDGKIQYPANEPLDYVLRPAGMSADRLIVVSFSDRETAGARALLGQGALAPAVIGPITNINDVAGKPGGGVTGCAVK